MIATPFPTSLALVLSTLLITTPASVSAPAKPRLMILADMGNEPDEVQQMHHLLICSNEVELEGLLAVTGKYLRPERKETYRQTLHPELFHQLIDGYEKKSTSSSKSPTKTRSFPSSTTAASSSR